MNRRKQIRYEKIIKSLLKMACPEKIPLTGPLSKNINCFSITIDKDNLPYLHLESVINGDIIGLEWQGNSYKIERKVQLSDNDYKNMNITHYLKGTPITFHGIRQYIFNRITKIIYIRLFIQQKLYDVVNIFYKKKNLILPARMKLLSIICNMCLSQPNQSITKNALMNKIYSRRWVIHPKAINFYDITHLLLDSLKRSNDIYLYEDKISITGDGIWTLEKYEKEKSKRRNEIILQILILIATIVLAVSSLIQVGIFETRKHPKEVTPNNSASHLTPRGSSVIANFECLESF
ncbi:MAG: hypothetical protein V1779_09910 [bacterium]